MGNSEEVKPSNSEKLSSPAPDQTNVHVYPDWTAMQAYYGARVALPPYYNSSVASGHAPHPYVWGPPQPMMPSYGAPYAALYSHGIYPHPAVPLVATTSNIETPGKSSANTDRGLMKKLKGFDGLAMSIGNGSSHSADGGADHRVSQSVNSGETEGSSDGSDGNTARAGEAGRKRSREGTPTIGGEGKAETQTSLVPAGETNAATDKVLGISVASASATGKLGGTVLSPSMTTTLELRNPVSVNAKTSPTSLPQGPQLCAVFPSEALLQNERELKRERRKQSNRESARRSRLRKQAETEELAMKVEALGAENVVLKSEINRLTQSSEKLRLENATLMEKLKNVQIGGTEGMLFSKADNNRAPPISTENLLSRVSNSGCVDRNPEHEGDAYEKSSNSGAKLRQLLDANPRANAVVAG
ncbi:common plant regulatory factor 1 isoform X6 [Malania oleifera]|uniref:common plant regulatory factor 1 isoform X6 n=1 Tax=Malania oleifera TaxID=397392 RepID=UPI0025AE3BF9|nr:common plant regulatory factor 1 isoform X6 [Malania oleifera]XP_057979038.1 common plant regulatory factor 1 isoform X6 [Malania oleifera]